jgi:hypothetical protein
MELLIPSQINQKRASYNLNFWNEAFILAFILGFMRKFRISITAKDDKYKFSNEIFEAEKTFKSPKVVEIF